MAERKGRPYTENMLGKLDCFVCGDKSRFQWNACADGNIWRPLCSWCDVRINMAVLQILYPKDWESKLRDYCKEIDFPYPFEERPNEQVKNQRKSGTKRAADNAGRRRRKGS